MPKQQHKKGGGARKIGRAARKPKNAKYKNNRQREKNKMKRILQSSGGEAALSYAKKNELLGYYKKLTS